MRLKLDHPVIRWVLVVVAFALTLTPQMVMALSGAREEEFATYDIMFYDPDDGEYCPPGSALGQNAVSGMDVTMIGDSITNRSTAKLQSTINGINIVAQDSKQFSGADNISNPTGTQLLQSLPLRSVVVFALGTNNSGLTAADVEKAVSLVGSRKLLFVTNYKLGDPTFYNSNNALLKSAAQNHENVAVADWATAVSASPEQYIDSSDGYNVHPSSEGEALFATTISTALRQFITISDATISSAAMASGSDNASMLLGFLIDSGYTQQSAAAISGNLQAESSGIDPTRFEGGVGNSENNASGDFRAISGNCATGSKTFKGGFGIAQWTSESRVQRLQCFADQNNLPVTSLEAQTKFLALEMSERGYSSGALNAMTFEDATFVIFRHYLTPCSSLARELYGCNNDYSPETFSDLDPVRTPAAVEAFEKRFNYAQQALGLSPSSPGFGGNCIGGASAWAGDGFPVYLQCDSRWKDLRFGKEGINGSVGSTICKAGCGPTSFAMMATALLGREILPSDTVDVAGRAGIYIAGSGSSWDVTRVLADHYGLQYEHIDTSRSTVVEDVSRYLREGWMIHSSGGGSYGSGAAPYSVGGHYVGIRGITSDGKWLIADSASVNRDQNKHWDPSDVLAAGMNVGNLWAIRP